jgi:hypothetical protein
MKFRRIIYLYYSLALHVSLVGGYKGFSAKSVLNLRVDERGNLIVFDKRVEAADISFK